MLNIALLIKKYSVPFLFGLIGFLLLLTGLMKNQSLEFIFAAIVIFLSAGVSALNVSGKISPSLTRIIGFVSLGVAIIVLFFTFGSVSETVEHQKDYKACKGLSIRNLKDAQTAQKAYLVKNKVYASDWNTLVTFIKEDSIAILDAEGSVPSRKITEKERDYLVKFNLYKKGQAIDNKMNEMDAYYLSKSPICPFELTTFRRDTVNVSFIETTFTKNRSYMKERFDNGYGEFVAESLKFIPFTEKKDSWKIDTATVVIGSDTLSTVLIKGTLPLTAIKDAPKKETMFFGKLDNNDLSGSWEVQ
ncbi:MAG: hypothetical protein QNK70_06120 [Crocinitomicaceae bacterium]